LKTYVFSMSKCYRQLAGSSPALGSSFLGVRTTVGQRVGGEVADFVVDNFLTLVNDRDESDERK